MLREESVSGPVPVPGVTVPATAPGTGSAGSSPEAVEFAAGPEEKNHCQKATGMLKTLRTKSRSHKVKNH